MDTEEILNITEDPETLWTRFATAILESFRRRLDWHRQTGNHQYKEL
jgi:hypothetical protein